MNYIKNLFIRLLKLIIIIFLVIYLILFSIGHTTIFPLIWLFTGKWCAPYFEDVGHKMLTFIEYE